MNKEEFIDVLTKKIVCDTFLVSLNKSTRTKPLKLNNIYNVAFLGDLMLGRRVGDIWIKAPDKCGIFKKYDSFFNNLLEWDLKIIKVANLESPFADKRYSEQRHLSLNADPELLKCLSTRFDLFTLANNHILDQGIKGMSDTSKNLEYHSLNYIGIGENLSEAWKGQVLTKADNNIAVIAASFTCYNDANKEKCNIVANIHNDQKFLKASIKSIKEINQKAAIVVIMHVGAEYNVRHNSMQSQFAKHAIDFGADIIIGHHPHVVQDIEMYKNKPIIYSLGNFIFDQDWNEVKITQKGLMPIVSFTFNADSDKFEVGDIRFFRVDIADKEGGFIPSLKELKINFKNHIADIQQCKESSKDIDLCIKNSTNHLSANLYKEMGIGFTNISSDEEFTNCLEQEEGTQEAINECCNNYYALEIEGSIGSTQQFPL